MFVGGIRVVRCIVVVRRIVLILRMFGVVSCRIIGVVGTVVRTAVRAERKSAIVERRAEEFCAAVHTGVVVSFVDVGAKRQCALNVAPRFIDMNPQVVV